MAARPRRDPRAAQVTPEPEPSFLRLGTRTEQGAVSQVVMAAKAAKRAQKRAVW